MGVFMNVAADPTSPEILEIQLRTTVEYEDGVFRDFINVFHYHKLASAGTLNLAQFLTNWITNVGDGIVPLMNVRITLGKAACRPLDDPFNLGVEQGLGSPAGLVTGDPLSAALALVMKMETGVRGRNFRGSKHFGGLSESDSDGGDEWKAGTLTNWSSPASTMGTTITDSGGYSYVPCVLSPTLSGIFQTPPFFTGADVTLCSVNPVIGTMRRRKEIAGG
jgi:hypothetical protein